MAGGNRPGQKSKTSLSIPLSFTAHCCLSSIYLNPHVVIPSSSQSQILAFVSLLIIPITSNSMACLTESTLILTCQSILFRTPTTSSNHQTPNSTNANHQQKQNRNTHQFFLSYKSPLCQPLSRRINQRTP